MSLLPVKPGMLGAQGGYLLDIAEAVGAYSLRVVSPDFATADIIVARRSSDDDEEGFTASEITDGTILSWAGANDAFVADAMDQSGNGYDLAQSINTKQPQIVSAGSLVQCNGMPALLGSGVTSTVLFCDVSPSPFSGVEQSWIAVGYPTTDGYYGGFGGGPRTNGAQRTIQAYTGHLASPYLNFRNASLWYGNDPQINTQVLLFIAPPVGATTTDEYDCWANGSLLSPSAQIDLPLVVPDGNRFGWGGNPYYAGAANHYFDGYLQELVMWNDTQVANRAAIESNINDAYSIY